LENECNNNSGDSLSNNKKGAGLFKKSPQALTLEMLENAGEL